ncbi:hypothetical protein NQ318_016626 [Aromia moschata]|uniref:Transposase n=1 Tax=Aromia moschata TaxID=1265417 RepID=A0AAV8X928_9CUCU|nr:hypothetical protein NQ318_016626 [Aromia moschata]
MLLVFGEARKNRTEAKALYGQRYPDRAQPHDKYFPWLERHLKTERIEEEPNEFIVSEEAQINTLTCIEVDLTTSVRQIAANIGIGRESVRKILKKHKFKRFKYQVHHHLYEADHQRWLEFCNWFMVQQLPNLNRDFIKEDYAELQLDLPTLLGRFPLTRGLGCTSTLKTFLVPTIPNT